MARKYEISIERRAEKDLDKLPRNIFKLAIKKILSLSQEPLPLQVKKLRTPYNDWRLRIGDYRVIYEIDNKQGIVRIFRVKHQEDVYR